MCSLLKSVVWVLLGVFEDPTVKAALDRTGGQDAAGDSLPAGVRVSWQWKPAPLSSGEPAAAP